MHIINVFSKGSIQRLERIDRNQGRILAYIILASIKTDRLEKGNALMAFNKVTKLMKM